MRQKWHRGSPLAADPKEIALRTDIYPPRSIIAHQQGGLCDSRCAGGGTGVKGTAGMRKGRRAVKLATLETLRCDLGGGSRSPCFPFPHTERPYHDWALPSLSIIRAKRLSAQTKKLSVTQFATLVFMR